MRNIQVSLENDQITAFDRMAKAEHKTRSAAAREAIREWIIRKKIEAFEASWIRAADKDQADESDPADEAWIEAESWEQP
jgi:predicted transcriptional regulator